MLSRLSTIRESSYLGSSNTDLLETFWKYAMSAFAKLRIGEQNR
jgi:hypothetical protein